MGGAVGAADWTGMLPPAIAQEDADAAAAAAEEQEQEEAELQAAIQVPAIHKCFWLIELRQGASCDP